MNILIWGCNRFAESLHICLENTTVNVVAFVDKISGKSFCRKPVIHPDLLGELDEHHDTPIIIASQHDFSSNLPAITFESTRQFKAMIDEITSKYTLQNTLHHPSSLIDVLHLTFPMKMATFGLPGSGNTLYSHIFRLILQKNRWHTIWQHLKAKLFKHKTPNLNDYFEKLAYEYQQIIYQVINDAIYQADGKRIHGSPWQLGTSHFSFLTDEEEKAGVFSFHTRDHIVHSNYGYHKMPTQQQLNELNLRQFKVFMVIRNPLDTIISVLKKNVSTKDNTELVADQYFAREAIATLETLKDLQKFTAHDASMIKYEDLIMHPVSQIRKIMRKLGKKNTSKAANRIWSQVSFRALPGATTENFWQGGTGKWESHFQNQHLAFLKYHGIEKILSHYGYHDILDKFKAKTDGMTQEYQSAISNHFLSFGKGDPTRYLNQNTQDTIEKNYGENNYIKLPHLIIACRNQAFLKKAASVLDNQYINQIVLCGHSPKQKQAI